MDRIIKHKKIVKELVESIGKMTPNDETTETQIILDDSGGYYVLFDIGWENEYRIYLPYLHLTVKKDGKIWIEHDGTDLVVADLLVEKGISKKEIVLAWQAPFRRKLIPEFAVE